jgi:hypothetical protein
VCLAVAVPAQLRLKCLEALLQLLQLVQGDAAATEAFMAAPAAAAAPQQQLVAGSSEGSSQQAGGAASSLSSVVCGCLSSVAVNDPSAAHKALAGQATAVLKDMGVV